MAKAIGRRGFTLLGGALAAGGLGLSLWPSSEQEAVYPLLRRVGADRDPLWRVSPDELARATEEDAERLVSLIQNLRRAVSRIEAERGLLLGLKPSDAPAPARKKARELWWQVFEPIVAIDDLKRRYAGWYGLDYVSHARLHARSFALGFAGLCAQVEAGLTLLRVLGNSSLAPTLFDEAVPELGLPSRTFSRVRQRLGRARDLFYVPAGVEWYETWIRRHLKGDTKVEALTRLLEDVKARALRLVVTPTSAGIANKVEIVEGELFQQWFPLQKNIAEWAGDTRFARAGRRLISDEQLAALQRELRPGDILLERRNWYLSNIGLPGFWPHAALYTGTRREILDELARDPEVLRAYGDLGARLASTHPAAWASLNGRDRDGHERRVVEAVSEGVVSASLEHSCGADYVAALRPRLSPLARAKAVERALSFWGRPYDFNFDFVTDDQVVCSELVIKAFEPADGQGKGLNVPFVEIAGRSAVPPTEFVRAFARELGESERTFDFVYFLDGREKEQKAVVADAKALAATAERPKWDIVQP